MSGDKEYIPGAGLFVVEHFKYHLVSRDCAILKLEDMYLRKEIDAESYGALCGMIDCIEEMEMI